MALIKRIEKGTALTAAEHDGNLEYLQGLATQSNNGSVTIVNDLTTGGATEAASAETVKTLQNNKLDKSGGTVTGVTYFEDEVQFDEPVHFNEEVEFDEPVIFYSGISGNGFGLTNVDAAKLGGVLPADYALKTDIPDNLFSYIVFNANLKLVDDGYYYTLSSTKPFGQGTWSWRFDNLPDLMIKPNAHSQGYPVSSKRELAGVYTTFNYSTGTASPFNIIIYKYKRDNAVNFNLGADGVVIANLSFPALVYPKQGFYVFDTSDFVTVNGELITIEADELISIATIENGLTAAVHDVHGHSTVMKFKNL